jgi:hypothetical protein
VDQHVVALVVAIVSTTVSLALLLIWVLPHLFSGSAHLRPEAIEQVRVAIDRVAAS